LLQSSRLALYREALDQLSKDGRLYPCTCTRKQLTGLPIYPGHCRPANPVEALVETDQTLRLRVTGASHFDDVVQGEQNVNLDTDVGDVIVWRRDAVFAYALVAAVDDSDDITKVIRGADLLSSTHIQRHLMQSLGRRIPDYGHVPVALDTDHRKLGKQTDATALDTKNPLGSLHAAWHFLGQENMSAQSIEEFWQHAIQVWDISKVPSTIGCVHA